MVPELLVLALEHQRQPKRFRRLYNPCRPLPPGFDALVKDLKGILSTARSAELEGASGRKAEELRSAMIGLFRDILLQPAANHYRVLGLRRSADRELIENHYRALVQLFHPDRNPPEDRGRTAADTARINAAYRVLKDPHTRARYDDELLSLAPAIRRPWKRRRKPSDRPRPPRRWKALAVPLIVFTGCAGAALCAAWLWSIADLRDVLRITDRSMPPPQVKPGFLTSSPQVEAPSARLLSRPAVDAPGQTESANPIAPDTATSAVLVAAPGREADSPEDLLILWGRHLHAGDLAALLQLASDDARIANVNAAVPQDSGDLFKAILARRLRLGSFKLTSQESDVISAQASLTLRSGPRAGDTVLSEGALVLEMVRQGGKYRVSALDYRLELDE